MSSSRCDTPLTHDEFLAAILGKPDRASVAAFAAALLGKDNPNGPGDRMGRSTLGISYHDWLNAVVDGAPRAAAALREYNFDPNQPRDERGRWTTGGAHGGTGAISENELQKMVAHLRASPAAEELYLEAQKALFADKEYKGKGALIINLFPDPKTFPKPTITTQPVPDVAQPNASNPKTGNIWIDRNDPRENVFETLLVELAHITRRRTFIDLIDNARKYTRDGFIRKMEEYEFLSMKRAAKVWKLCWQDWKCPRYTPSWGDPDDILRMTFEEHWRRLAAWHKEIYGRLWDNLTR